MSILQFTLAFEHQITWCQFPGNLRVYIFEPMGEANDIKPGTGVTVRFGIDTSESLLQRRERGLHVLSFSIYGATAAILMPLQLYIALSAAPSLKDFSGN